MKSLVSTKYLAVGLLLALAIGLPTGFLMSQSSPKIIPDPSSTLSAADYTKVKVPSDTLATATFGVEPNKRIYFFYYKSLGHYDVGGNWISDYDYQRPITVEILGQNTKDYNLPPTEGETYDVYGIRVIVSEVHDDYVVLFVKSP